MVKPLLVAPEIDAGAELVERLERDGWPPEAAFWLYNESSEDWSLVLAWSDVDTVGRLETLSRLQPYVRDEDLNKFVSLSNISVVSPKDRKVHALRKRYRDHEDVSNIHVVRLFGDDAYIPEALLYRL